jgi:hypothetical protein
MTMTDEMYWDFKTVKPLPDFRIYVEIEDGRKDIFDLNPYLDHGIFRELRDVHYFNQVGIQFGAVTWPNEQDIAPETLLAEMLPVESIPKQIEARLNYPKSGALS